MAACRAPGPHARRAHIPPPPALAQSPPATPSSVSLTRDVGTLTASWPEVSGATHYHVTYSSDGTNSWSLAAFDHPAAGNTTEGIVSITINGVDNGKYYIVGVRAKNANGGSGWVNSDFVHPLYTPDPIRNLNAARSGTGIAVSWTAPANTGGTAITGYDVNYSTDGGRSWTRAVSGTNSTSADISNADNTVDYIIAVRANNGMGNGGWTNSGTLPGLGAPASATISRAAGSVTVTWSAVAGATGYNINLSTDAGGSWGRAASNHTGTSATISSGIVNGSSYIAAVQAVNAHGGSHWTNSNSVAGIYPPGAPTGVTATRSGTGISVSWTAPASNGGVALAGYDVNYSTDGARSWTRLASNQSGTTATISSADNAVDYIIAARANNSVGGSAWARSATVAGLDAPEYVTAFRYPAAGFTDAGWPAVEGATGYDVNLIYNGMWHYNMANNVSGTTHRVKDGTQYPAELFVIAVRARNAHGPGPWRNSPPATETRTLTASDITMTSATLTLETFADTWYYKADKVPHNTCSSGQTGLTADLSDLSAGETYTYTAYRDSGCATAVVTGAAFTLPGVSVSNLTNGAIGNNGIASTSRHAAAFTTGSHTGGYTLHSFTAETRWASGTGNLDWAIYTATTDTDPKPDTEVQGATISGSNPTGTTYANYTFTCSGSGCTLDPDTTYFLLATTSSGATYMWHYTTDLSETAAPSDNGWEIGKGWLRNYANNVWGDWVTYNDVSKFKVSATLNPTLAAASDTATTATLTISHHSGAWWYKGNQSGATCTPVAAGTSSASLSSLTAGTSYTYKAYDASGCASANEIATLTFKQGAGFRDSGKDITLHADNANPFGIWSDGTTMWVVDVNDKKLYAYTLATKARDASKDITLDASKILYSDLTSDGTTMWVAEVVNYQTLFAYSISSKSADSSKNLTLDADNTDVEGMWTDGTTMWVNDETDQKIYAYTLATGARDTGKDITMDTDNADADALWSDGTTVWVLDGADAKLYAYRMSDGSRDSAKDYTNLSWTEMRGIWSDGTTMWVADNADDKLYAYHAISSQPSNTSGSARLGSSQSAMVSSMTAPIPPQGTDAPLNPATAFASGFSGSPGQATGASAGNAAGLPGYVSSLTSAQSGGTQLKAGDLAGVAFTTGPHPDGYTLDSVTATLAAVEGEADLVWSLHELAGDTYGADSQPAPTARATLTGTAPTADEFTDLTYTCAGDGCALAPNTTYFVVAESVGSGVVSWAFIFSSASLSETTVPANNGWSLGHGHYSADAVTWTTFQDWQHTRLDFTPR